MMNSSAFSDQLIKKPNVSGQFYHADAGQLSKHIDYLFKEAANQPLDQHVDIVIAPQAEYVYSGGVAAHGFKAVSKNNYKTIVILAPSHFFGFDGVSVWAKGGFETPLGVVDVDEEFTQKVVAADNRFIFEPKAFDREHSLEVEIPFLQKTFTGFKIVPVIMGQPSFELLDRFAEVLHSIIGDRKDVLVVVSTDLSHYHDDAKARKMDKTAIDAIQAFEAKRIWQECQLRTNMEMCGCIPVTASLLYAKKKGLENIEVLKYANSGDVSGDKDRVVGYTSIVIYNGHGKGDVKTSSEENINALSMEQKKQLIDIARDTIELFVREGKVPKVDATDPRLKEIEGAFVTIHKHGKLRGCIGNIIGQQPLCLTVRDMAVSSATKDPRFKPLTVDELDEIDVEVSVLSKPRRVSSADEIELGKHGVIVSRQPNNYGVFLPQVATDTGWSKEEFLSQLCAQKARLPADAWKDPETKLEVFTAEVFSEKDVQ